MKHRNKMAAAFLLSASFGTSAAANIDQNMECNDAVYERGVASVYASSLAGNQTANGELYTPTRLTAAHLTLPFGTVVEVTDTQRDTQVLVVINDRGPFVDGRVIDLSDAARRALGDTNRIPGLHRVALRLCPQ